MRKNVRPADGEIRKTLENWPQVVVKYQQSNHTKAIIQMVTTFLPFICIWVLMYFSLEWSYWLTLALAVINAFFMVRIFIIQHDCGHQSFFSKRKANNAIGLICSFFSSVPYKYWSRSHSFHHAHCGQLEVRDIGDINTLTVREYKALGWAKRLGYRIFRHPVILFIFGPIYYLLVNVRFPLIKLAGWKKIKWSQFFNNVYMLLIYALVGTSVGWQKFFLVHVPIIVIFAIIAIWFFYVQHQHEHTYKQWKENWEYLFSSIKGSTYYKLPKLFQWLTGNIGLHHIHHLSSKIPNYHLQKCADENPVLSKYVTTIGFFESLSFVFNHLWDEDTQRMISFWKFNRLERAGMI